MSTDLAKIIKKIIANYMENEKLCNIVYGTYTGNGLKIDGKPLVIPIDFVDIPERLKEYLVKVSISLDEKQCDELIDITLKDDTKLPIKSINIKDMPCKIVYDELKSGNRVAVIQKQGSQKFSIMDKV